MLTPWREAASLVIISKQLTKYSNNQNLYKTLLLKRSEKSGFNPNSYVFPGGVVDKADFSPRWWSVFKQQGIDKESLIFSISQRCLGLRPPIINNSITLSNLPKCDDYLPPDVAFRITALRESFEETALSFITNKNGENLILSLSKEEKLHWTTKIQQDANVFIDFCLSFDSMPNIWSIYEWSNFLTPAVYPGKRFDTLFYLGFINDEDHDIILSKDEMSSYFWEHPTIVLKKYSKKAINISLPQIMEMCRIVNKPSFQELKEFAIQREIHGLERWMPVFSICKDGFLATLPGDDLYPSEPDLTGIPCIVERSESYNELRQSCKSLFRIELRNNCYCFICTKELPCNQLIPQRLDLVLSSKNFNS